MRLVEKQEKESGEEQGQLQSVMHLRVVMRLCVCAIKQGYNYHQCNIK